MMVMQWWVVLTVCLLLLGSILLIALGVSHGKRRAGAGPTIWSEVATDVGIALLTGLVVSASILLATEGLEERRFDHETRRDNIRFVREVATQPEVEMRPFRGLDLKEAQLAGLSLSGADFSLADLSGADLSRADLSDSNMQFTDLSGAHLREVDLSGADLSSADLSRTVLSDADLSDSYLLSTDLSEADLAFADLTRVRYDEGTVWPQGFAAPPNALPD